MSIGTRSVAGEGGSLGRLDVCMCLFNSSHKMGMWSGGPPLPSGARPSSSPKSHNTNHVIPKKGGETSEVGVGGGGPSASWMYVCGRLISGFQDLDVCM